MFIRKPSHDIESLLLTRAEANSLIRAQAGCEGCHVLDLHAMLPFDHYGRGWSAAYPDCDTPSLWHADGLHFSPLGYARIGELCFALIRDGKLAGAALARRAQRPSQPPPSWARLVAFALVPLAGVAIYALMARR